MDLSKTLHIASAGMQAQGTRLRLIAENLANTDSVGQRPGDDPYRRQTIHFENALNRELGINQVKVSRLDHDQSDFGRKFEPGHPAADEEGYILTPNVNGLIEMADMREAQRSYESNLKIIESSRDMLQQTVGILR